MRHLEFGKFLLLVVDFSAVLNGGRWGGRTPLRKADRAEGTWGGGQEVQEGQEGQQVQKGKCV